MYVPYYSLYMAMVVLFDRYKAMERLENAKVCSIGHGVELDTMSF